MIAIKRMELPKNCAECPMYNSDVDDYCDITGEWITGEEMVRHKDCPLIEIIACKDCISREAALDTKVLIELPDGQSFYCISPEDVETLPPVTVTDFADKCKECGARYGKQLKKLERIKVRYNEEREILLNSNLEYTPNNVLDIIDYIICGD